MYQTGDAPGAIAALDTALPAFPTSAFRDEMRYVRALAANKMNDVASALKFEEELIRDLPASPFADDALFDAALIQFKQKQFGPSLAKLDALLGKPAPKADLKNVALQLRASARLQLGQAPGALADAEELLAKGTADARLSLPALRIVKAMALLAQNGKEADALAAFDDLIVKGPSDAAEVRQGLARRAYILFKNKKYAAAKADFVQLSDPAKALSPQEALDAALHLAVIHRELKETPQAKALLEKLAGQKTGRHRRVRSSVSAGQYSFRSCRQCGRVEILRTRADEYRRCVAGIVERRAPQFFVGIAAQRRQRQSGKGVCRSCQKRSGRTFRGGSDI